jgi:hypothetical protein
MIHTTSGLVPQKHIIILNCRDVNKALGPLGLSGPEVKRVGPDRAKVRAGWLRV